MDDRHGKRREAILEYDRQRAKRPERRANAKRVIARWTQEHPDRRKASHMVNNAIRDGRLIPWPVCAVPECNLKPEAHHPDYDNPLGVSWLCSAHHKQAHALTHPGAPD